MNKDVLESLRLKYPKIEKGSTAKGTSLGKGNQWGGKGNKPCGKGDRPSYKGSPSPSSWDRPAVRSRSRARGRGGGDRKGDKKDAKGKKELGGKGDGKDGGKFGGKNSDPRVQKAFQLGKQGEKYCPF